MAWAATWSTVSAICVEARASSSMLAEVSVAAELCWAVVAASSLDAADSPAADFASSRLVQLHPGDQPAKAFDHQVEARREGRHLRRPRPIHPRREITAGDAARGLRHPADRASEPHRDDQEEDDEHQGAPDQRIRRVGLLVGHRGEGDVGGLTGDDRPSQREVLGVAGDGVRLPLPVAHRPGLAGSLESRVHRRGVDALGQGTLLDHLGVGLGGHSGAEDQPMVRPHRLQHDRRRGAVGDAEEHGPERLGGVRSPPPGSR